MLSRSRLGVLAVVSVFGLVGAGCSSDTSSSSKPTTADDATPSDDGAAVANPCAPADGETVAKALVRCGDASVAYVSTPMGNGTGVVIADGDDRYLLTNAHVVDPYGQADVIVARETFESMPVVGIDVVSDIAVLGPFNADVELSPIPLVADPVVERGDDAYVVGYPGELYEPDPEDLEPNISRGIMGRTRNDKSFELTYFQSDASITSGQSGGGIFDLNGNLVGITGMAWAEEYTLAVSTKNALDSIETILAGEGHEYGRLADSADAEGLLNDTAMVLTDELSAPTLHVPAADEDRTVEFRFSPTEQIAVSVSTSDGDVLAVSSRGMDYITESFAELGGDGAGMLEEMGMSLDDIVPEEARQAEVEPGLLRFELTAELDALIEIQPMNGDERVDLDVESTAPFQVASYGAGVTTVAVGDELDVLIAPTPGAHVFEIELEAGDVVTLEANTPIDDLAVMTLTPEADLASALLYSEGDGITVVDDNYGGPMENPESATITAEAAGTYRFMVHTFSGMTALARVAITAG